MAAEKKFKVPKSLAACVDLLYSTREARLNLQKEVEEIKGCETLLQEHLINSLSKSDTTGIVGKLASVVIETKVVPRVEDWDQLYRYIARTKNFSFLQRRLGDAAVQELWDSGKEVPGIGRFNVVVPRLRKR